MNDDPNRPVLLAVMPTEAEAAMLVGFLFSQGIKAFASGAGSALGLAILVQPVDVQVVVRQCDIDRATELLRLFDEDEPGDDPES